MQTIRLHDVDRRVVEMNVKTDEPEYVGAYYHLAALFKSEERMNEAMSTYIKGMEIAKKLGNQHAYSELQNAKFNMEIEE